MVAREKTVFVNLIESVIPEYHESYRSNLSQWNKETI